MIWTNCLYFINNEQCKCKKFKNGLCKNHLYKKFKSEYIFTCISGEGFLNPTKIINQTDIISLDTIWEYKNNKKKLALEFDRELLFSFIDENNLLYGFNITSLVPNLRTFINSNIRDNTILNPITKNELSLLNKIKLKLKIQYLLDFQHPVFLIQNNVYTPFQKMVSIIVKLEGHGYYFNPNWFKNLTSIQIKNIINETKLIWNTYNTMLDFDTKFICDLNMLVDFYNLILNKNIDIVNKIIFILGGLTYVLDEVKAIYPNIAHE